MSAHTPMAVAAAKALCRRSAEQCGVDAEDSWKVYGDDYLADAAAMLDACGATELLEALQVVVRDWTAQFERAGHAAPAWCRQARAAIAKATGAAS